MTAEFSVKNKENEIIPAKWNKRLINLIIDIIIVDVIFIIINDILIFYQLKTRNNEITLLDIFIFFLLYLLYYTFFETVFNRTPAKYFTKTIVVNINNSPASFRQILLRSLYRFLPFNYFKFMDKNPLCMHDLLSKTYVIDILSNDNETKIFPFGKQSILIALFSFLIYIFIIIYSVASGEETPPDFWIVLVVLNLLLNIIGFISGVIGLLKKNEKLILSIFGAIINFIFIVLVITQSI